MPLPEDLLLFGAGALASAVNAAAGGGTLLSFPALLAAGLSPLAANATSTVGLLPGALGSVVAFRRELREDRADVIRIAVPSLAGGVLGAVLLLALGGRVFAAIVPALLIGASALILLQPILARLLARAGPPRDRHPVALFLANLAIAVYGGYFGAGAGILFLGAMGLLMARDLSRINALKMSCALLTNAIGAATFVVAEIAARPGAVVPRAALPLALGAVFGGYGAVHLVRRLPAGALRGVAGAVGLAIAAWLLFS